MTAPVAGAGIVALGHYEPRDGRLALDETVADLATAAAERALAGSGLAATDIDLVLVGTCSAVDRAPNVACRVAGALGIRAPGACDVNAVCAGFSYALATADHAIRAGASRHAIVIGAEKMSDFADLSDPVSADRFGDGAGAAVVTAVRDGAQVGIGPVVWGSRPDADGAAMRLEGWRGYVERDSERLARWVDASLAPLARQACERAGVAPADLAALVVQPDDTFSAAVPLALSKLVERREIPAGVPVLLFAFGGDFTYAGQVVRCP